MIRQVFVNERITVDGNTRIENGQLAFGSHEDLPNDDGVVSTALPIGGQEIRIVLDELLVGNAIEEMACADGSWSYIPPGTTPDDVAKCAGPVDSLLDCKKVCLNADGSPIGILDEEPEDSAPDQLRMIDYGGGELAASIICDDTMIPLSQTESFWNPSGNQQIPANPAAGYRGLGPVLVLTPSNGLRTGAECKITFRNEPFERDGQTIGPVTDNDGNLVCAPEGGNPDNGCTPGDTARISFNVESLQITDTVPKDGDDMVDAEGNAFMLVSANAALNGDIIADVVELTENGTPISFWYDFAPENPVTFTMGLGTAEAPLPFQPLTDYCLTVTTALEDQLGGTLPEPYSFCWKTEDFVPPPDAAPVPDAGIDAAP
jgi:hypothetical protein